MCCKCIRTVKFDILKSWLVHFNFCIFFYLAQVWLKIDILLKQWKSIIYFDLKFWYYQNEAIKICYRLIWWGFFWLKWKHWYVKLKFSSKSKKYCMINLFHPVTRVITIFDKKSKSLPTVEVWFVFVWIISILSAETNFQRRHCPHGLSGATVCSLDCTTTHRETANELFPTIW